MSGALIGIWNVVKFTTVVSTSVLAGYAIAEYNDEIKLAEHNRLLEANNILLNTTQGPLAAILKQGVPRESLAESLNFLTPKIAQIVVGDINAQRASVRGVCNDKNKRPLVQDAELNCSDRMTQPIGEYGKENRNKSGEKLVMHPGDPKPSKAETILSPFRAVLDRLPLLKPSP